MSPLEGLRVPDLARGLAESFATAIPADFGAGVIKPGPPQGDANRRIGTFRDGKSARFALTNRGGTWVVIDLGSAAGQALARQIAARCDVVVGSVRPGVAERLGLGPELQREDPRLVCSTGGPRGGHVWELDFDCRVPDENRVAPVGSGFRTAMRVLDHGRVEVADIARTALAASVERAKSRVIRGRASGRAPRHRVDARRHGDRPVRRRAAGPRGRPPAPGGRFTAASHAKLFASEIAGRNADAAIQIHGGYGCTHDLRIMRSHEGSSELQRNIIAGHLLPPKDRT